MSEDVPIQPSEDTSASDGIQPHTAEAKSLNEGVPVQLPESVSEDFLAKAPEETGTSEVVPANSNGSSSASEEAPVKTFEDASVSEEAPPSSEGASTSENVSEKPLEGANEVVPANSTVITNISEDTPVKTPQSTSTSEVAPVKKPVRTARSGPLWLNIVKRVLVGVVMVLILVGLLINISQLVGVWAAYGPARDGVTTVSNTLQQALQVADKGLTRVNGYVTQARQVVTQVNNVVTLIGDHAQKNSPIITALAQRIDTKFSPSLEQAQTTAATVHDAALKVNGALVVLNRFPNVSVPTLSDQLSAISNRALEAQSAMQDLRATLTNIKAGVVTKVETAVTKITVRIDAALAKIQSLINTYQGKVTNAQNRMTSTTDQVLTLLLVTAISLTILCMIVAAALLLFFIVCLQYVIHGRFPSLRVAVNKGG